MNWVDIVILCILSLLVFNGLRKGFIISLASLVALVLGVWGAMHFSYFISPLLQNLLHPSGTWLPILSFAITFVILIIIVFLIAKGIEKLVDLAGMSFLNHIAGAFLGLVKGLLLASVLIYIVSSFDTKEKLIPPTTKEKSLLYDYVEKVFPGIMGIFGCEKKFHLDKNEK
jgi:membrane protein required for colicin V production